jgi:hypothetical protein
MSSLYGMKPEPMPLDQQRAMALIVLGKQIISRQELRPVRGPALSSRQLERWFPGLPAIGEVSLTLIWDPETEELLHVLEDSGRPDQWMELGAELMPAESLINLAAGGRIEPQTLLKRGNPCVGHSHGMGSFSLLQLVAAAGEWFSQSPEGQVWSHEDLSQDQLNDLLMGELGSGMRLDLAREGQIEIVQQALDPEDEITCRTTCLSDLGPAFASAFRAGRSAS